jgi:hypothetical protein
MNISTSGFDADALETLKNGDLIINFADLMTTGDIANGIFASASDVRIRNFGAIETSGEGAAGIFLQGESARVENFATVVTHGDFYNPSPVFGDEFFSEGIFVDGDRFTSPITAPFMSTAYSLRALTLAAWMA